MTSVTPTEQDKMSDIDKLEKRLSEWAYRVSIGDLMPDTLVRGAVQLITADRKRVALEARIDPFDFVESCEPDCDDIRHAYHQGQWDMATRIKAQQEEV